MTVRFDLDQLDKKFIDKLDEFFTMFNIEYSFNEDKYTFACPIHGGRKNTSVSLFIGDRAYVPNWKCFTQHCEEIYGSGLYGLVRGILSTIKESEFTNSDTIRWMTKFVGLKLEESVVDTEIDSFVRQQTFLKSGCSQQNGRIPRELVRSSLQIPASFYINRGYSYEILDRYDIGVCQKRGAEMVNRVVVPVYDDTGNYMIGCCGRTLDPKYTKWRNSKNFRSDSCLYNYWFSKSEIEKSGTAILVEGPPDIWKLEQEGIHNGVALFGTALSKPQLWLLGQAGATSLVLALDNDEAGQKGINKIKNQCGNLFSLYGIRLEEKDVGESQNLTTIFGNLICLS